MIRSKEIVFTVNFYMFQISMAVITNIPKILPRVAALCRASRLHITASLRRASLAASLLSNSMADTLREPFVESDGSLRGAESTVSMESQLHVNTRRHSFTPILMTEMCHSFLLYSPRPHRLLIAGEKDLR